MAIKINLGEAGRVPCPECRERIFPSARKCPHCHSDLTTNPQWKTQRPPLGCSAALLCLISLLLLSWLV